MKRKYAFMLDNCLVVYRQLTDQLYHEFLSG